MIWWHKKSNYPTFFRTYLERIENEGYSTDIISLDLETTGMDPYTDQILSFGSVPIIDRKIIVEKEVHRFFRVDKDIKNAHIHEILETHRHDSFEEFIPDLIEMIGNKKILGHFIKIDLSFINHHLKKMGLPKLRNPSIDTLEMALEKRRPSPLQNDAREEFSLYNLT